MRSRPCLGPMAAARAPVERSGVTADAARNRAVLPTTELAPGGAVNLKIAPGQAARRFAVAARTTPRPRAWRAAIGLLALAGLWAALTGGAAESWVMGAPAVLLGTALIFLHPGAPRWRLSLPGALRFLAWFALQSVRGAVDVARRAMAWRLPLAPGCRCFQTALPEGAPRLLFANAITLLPGTLTAEIEGDLLVVHMLDTGADLDGELSALEMRVAALFALPASGGVVTEATT